MRYSSKYCLIFFFSLFVNYSPILSQNSTTIFSTVTQDCYLSQNSVLECYQRCRVKYKGFKNYFNSTNGLCQPVTTCLQNQSYNYLTNSCSAIQPDYSAFPNTTSSLSSNTNSIVNGTLTIPKINCVNGFTPNNSSICICYTGWTDDNSGNTLNVVQKCNRVLDGFSNQTTNSSNSPNFNMTTAQISNTSFIIGLNSTDATNSVSTGLPPFYVMIIIICSAVVLCCMVCGCLIFRKYKNHREEQDYPQQERQPYPQYFNTGQVRPLNRVANNSNRDSTGYIHPFYYPYQSQYQYNINDNTTEQVFEVRENPERINRQLTYNTPVKTKKIYIDDHIVASARMNYPKSDMTCKYTRRQPEDYYGSFRHNMSMNPYTEPGEDGSYIVSDIERDYRLNEDNLHGQSSLYVKTSPIRKSSQTLNSKGFFNNSIFYSPNRRRMMTEMPQENRSFYNYRNYESDNYHSQIINSEDDNYNYQNNRGPRSKIVNTPIKSFLNIKRGYY